MMRRGNERESLQHAALIPTQERSVPAFAGTEWILLMQV